MVPPFYKRTLVDYRKENDASPNNGLRFSFRMNIALQSNRPKVIKACLFVPSKGWFPKPCTGTDQGFIGICSRPSHQGILAAPKYTSKTLDVLCHVTLRVRNIKLDRTNAFWCIWQENLAHRSIQLSLLVEYPLQYYLSYLLLNSCSYYNLFLPVSCCFVMSIFNTQGMANISHV